MAAWTTIAAGMDWQDAAVIAELCKGIWERATIFWPNNMTDAPTASTAPAHYGTTGASAAFVGARYDSTDPNSLAAIDQGDQTIPNLDIQSVDFWYMLQYDMLGLVVGYRNMGTALAGSTAPLMYTQATWLAAAGMAASGLRRVPLGNDYPADWTDLADASYEYGYIQAGDIIGPWLFDDLQRGLSAMTHTARIWIPSSRAWYYGSGYPPGADCPAIHAAVAAAWAGSSAWGSYLYAVYAHYYESGGSYYGDAGRVNIDALDVDYVNTKVASVPTVCLRKTGSYAAEGFTDPDDPDSLGLGDHQNFILFETLGSSSAATRTASPVTTTTTCPTGGACDNTVYGCFLNEAAWEFEWAFANA